MPLKPKHRFRKGLVTDVSGPQRNACPGTLTSQEGLVSLLGAERMRSHFAVATGPALRAGNQVRTDSLDLQAIKCSPISDAEKLGRQTLIELRP
jgi:hypothetical protein